MDEFESLLRPLTVGSSPKETEVKTKPTLEIRQKFGVENCETCGSYSYSETEFYLNNELIHKDSYDDHLGGGPNLDDLIFLVPLFEKLGYNVIYSSKDDND